MASLLQANGRVPLRVRLAEALAPEELGIMVISSLAGCFVEWCVKNLEK